MVVIAYFTVLGFLILPALDYFLGLALLPDLHPSKEKDVISPQAKSGISAIIACHNEVKCIERKVLEIEEQFKDAHVDVFEIIVVSDGSDDGSNEVLQRLDDESKIIYKLVEKRKGKPNAINMAISLSKYPLLLFSDVRQTLSKGAVSALLSHFSDPNVGGVTSQIELEGDASFTRRLMNKLKLWESNKGSTTGMCGALYTVRKELIKELPIDTILDDLVIALLIMQRGKRVILEPQAIVYDVSWDLFYSGRRQGRITAGLVQIIKKQRRLIWDIGLKQQIFLYGQKYMKYVAPLLFISASVIAFFDSSIRGLHFIISGTIIALLVIWRPRFIGETMRLILSYMAQLLKLDKYSKIKWERR